MVIDITTGENRHIATFVVAFLNGKQLEHCFMVDTVGNKAHCWHYEDGHPVDDEFGERKFEELEGKITLIPSQDAPQWVVSELKRLTEGGKSNWYVEVPKQ